MLSHEAEPKISEAKGSIAGILRDLLAREEAKSELVLNAIFLYVCVPFLALLTASIVAVQGLSWNAAIDVSSVVLLAAYYLPIRFALKRGGYRGYMKYLSASVNTLICGLTLVGYSFDSGWIHSLRTIVTASYILVIAISGLYHDPRVPIFTAVASIFQYSGIAAYAVFGAKLGIAPVETFHAPEYSFDVYAFLMFCFAAAGAVSAYGCSRFRSTLARSLSSEASSRAMAELDAQKTYFFSNVSHELRTPLTLILSPLESVLAGDMSRLDVRQRGYLEVIHQNSLRLLKLINNLLDFTKLEAGKMRLRPQNTGLAAAIEYYLLTLRPAADAKGIALELSLEGSEGLVVSLDRSLFEKAFFNLLSNALKFTDEGGRVRVELRSGGDGFELSVSDNGIGIPGDKLGFVFERFNQVDSTLSRKYEGTGIGLSLAKDIVELHGGRIAVRSELGVGSTFTIAMPIGQVDAAPAEPLKVAMPSMLSDFAPWGVAPSGSGPAEAGLRPRDPSRSRVLVIDDNRELRDYLASFLGEDYEVLLAADGNEGLATIRSARPDLVVSDVMMPGMNGYALCATVKRDPEISAIPIILLTARAEASMKIAGYEVGADDYLGKPFSAEELLAKIRVFIGREEMRKKLDGLAAELHAMNGLLEKKVEERTAQVEAQFYQILDSLANALEEKDPYTQGHSLRVERYSMLLADELGLALADKERLSIAARLHDIGKIGIPEHILNKTGRLSAAEFEIIKTHPERGARILAPFSGFESIVEATRLHHERYDGSGYLGRAREGIPPLARILAVADAFDAMTTTRAYRPAMRLDEALAELERCAGSQFDPEVAAAFISAAHSHWSVGEGPRAP